MRRWLAVFALLSLITVGFHSAATPLPAAALGCLDTATWHEVYLPSNQWSGFYYAYASTYCTDLNLRLVNFPTGDIRCTVTVDAWYYSKTRGAWIPAAGGYVGMQPYYWYTPLTNVADLTQIAWRYYGACSTPGRYIIKEAF
jgi:hypothetical protein